MTRLALFRWISPFLFVSALLAQTRFEHRPFKDEHPPVPGELLAPLDVDGDGDLDLIVGRVFAPFLQLHRNDGTGSLVGGSDLPLSGGHTVRSLVSGDFSGDGSPDLLALVNVVPPSIPFEQYELFLLVNDGAGRFTNVSTSVGLRGAFGSMLWATSGDVDGDGDLDVAAHTSGDELLFVNDGTGHFTEASAGRLPPVTSSGGWSVVLADLDGDSDLDLTFSDATAALDPLRTRVYENDGLGYFAVSSSIRVPTTPFVAEYAADIDSDGDVDLLVSGLGSGLLRNDGAGTFAADSRMPVVVAGSLFTRGAASWGMDAPSLFDIDADGDLDLSVGSQLLVQDAAGAFRDESRARGLRGANGSASCAVDWDRDGDLDLTLGDGVRYSNDGLGHFGATWVPRLPEALSGGAGVAFADVDGNGEVDLLAPGRILTQHDGRFVDESASRFPGTSFLRWFDIAVGDFDGDGDADLAGCAYSQSGAVPVLALNGGDGAFAPVPLPTRSHVRRCEIADVDSDGDLDLLFAGGGRISGTTLVYANDGSATFADVSSAVLPAPQASSCIAIGDVDGDGDVDLVLGSDDRNRLLVSVGARFVDVTGSSLPGHSDRTTSVALGDIDGDGDLDLFVGNAAGDRLLINDGAGVFADATSTGLPLLNEGTNGIRFADLDLDGDLDLLLATDSAGQRVLSNDGRGRYSDGTTNFIAPSGHRTNAAELADLDEDGDLDVVLVHGGPQPVFGGICCGSPDRALRLLTNLTTHLEAPRLAVPGRTMEFAVRTRGLGDRTGIDAAVLALSLVRARIPIPGGGVLGVDPNQLLFSAVFPVPRASGQGAFSLPIPNVPGLAGTAFYSQAVVLGPGHPGRVTNRLVDRVFP